MLLSILVSFAAIVALPVVLAPAVFSTDDDDDDDRSVVVIISAVLASPVVDGADNDDEESSATLLFDVKGHFCAESSSPFLPLLVLIADHVTRHGAVWFGCWRSSLVWRIFPSNLKVMGFSTQMTKARKLAWRLCPLLAFLLARSITHSSTT